MAAHVLTRRDPEDEAFWRSFHPSLNVWVFTVLPIMFGALIDLTGVRSSAFMLFYDILHERNARDGAAS